MKSSLFGIYLLIVVSCNNAPSLEGMFTDKLTGNNAVSYTDVTYAGNKDTVLVTTYSGRVVYRFKNQEQENVLTQFNDEIYVVRYNPVQKQVALSTMQSGIVVIDAKNGKELHKLPVKESWCLKMGYSKDFEYLFASDQKGNRFVWTVNENYKPVNLYESMPKGTIKSIENNVIQLVAKSKVIYWNLTNSTIIKEVAIKFNDFEDIDADGNILNIDRNTLSLYNIPAATIKFTLQHPGWLRPLDNFSQASIDKYKKRGITIKNGYLEEPGYHLPLTSAIFGKDEIFTSSIDRSIRVWDKDSGKLLNSLTGHKATVNKIKLSDDKNQLVSIDLKGGIRFWQIQKSE